MDEVAGEVSLEYHYMEQHPFKKEYGGLYKYVHLVHDGRWSWNCE